MSPYREYIIWYRCLSIDFVLYVLNLCDTFVSDRRSDNKYRTVTTTSSSNRPSISIAVRYCLYAQIHEDDERQSLSIDSHIKEMTVLAEHLGIQDTPCVYMFIQDIQNDIIDGILTQTTDRTGLGSIVVFIDSGKLREIRTHE